MNISGITQTEQIVPNTQQQPQQSAPAQESQGQSAEQVQSVEADSVNLSAQVSTQVLDMAQRQFEEAANELISSMAAATGIGSNVDVAV